MHEDRVLKLENLVTHFFTNLGVVRAVDGVSFTVPRKKIVGIVGESGCGKSVLARSILGIVAPPGRIVHGSILYYGSKDGDPIDLARLPRNGESIRSIRGKEISMIFQEPMTCLSPVYTVGNQLIEAIRICNPGIGKISARKRALELIRDVGIPSPEKQIDSYVFELSGGMRQRILIAIALAGAPKLLIADEPTTAIDVTIQAKVLDLLKEIQRQNMMSILYITHNIGVIAEIADEVIVMYLGIIVEKSPVLELFDHPKHPYTRMLLRSIPGIGVEPKSRLAVIEGSVPDPFSRPSGCPFHNRCQQFMAGICDVQTPKPVCIDGLHHVCCHLYGKSQINGKEPS